MISDYEHPCEIDKKITKSKNKLCNIFTKKMGHNLKAIMKALRFSLGRGKSHFNITHLLEELNGQISYDTKSYNPDWSSDLRDINSILPYCKLKMIEAKGYEG